MAKVKFGGRQKLAVKTLRIFIAVKVNKSESKEEVIILLQKNLSSSNSNS